MKAYYLVICSVFLLSACSSHKGSKVDLASIPDEWVRLTEKDGELVVFNSCDAGNLLISLKKINDTFEIVLHGQQEDATYQVLDAYEFNTSIRIETKCKDVDIDGERTFDFIWLDKRKELSKWVTNFQVSNSLVTTNDICVTVSRQSDFPTIDQPCRECWMDCDDIEKDSSEIIK